MRKWVLSILLCLLLVSFTEAQMKKTVMERAPMFGTRAAFASVVLMSGAKDLLALARAGQFMMVPRGTPCKIVGRDDYILEVSVQGYPGTWFTHEQVFRLKEWSLE